MTSESCISKDDVLMLDFFSLNFRRTIEKGLFIFLSLLFFPLEVNVLIYIM